MPPKCRQDFPNSDMEFWSSLLILPTKYDKLLFTQMHDVNRSSSVDGIRIGRSHSLWSFNIAFVLLLVLNAFVSFLPVITNSFFVFVGLTLQTAYTYYAMSS